MVRIRLLLLVACMLLPGLAAAGPARFDALYVFGDSLSDPGNAYTLSGGELNASAWPPSPPYYQRFSNGLVAAELLANSLDIAMAPAAGGGTNFAVGGATTGTRNYSFEVDTPAGLPPVFENTGMSTQVGGFLDSNPVFNPNSSLFMLWAGANDIFLGLEQNADMSIVVSSAITNLSTSILALAAVGAIDFLVPNMPNLALTPFSQGLTSEGRDALATISLGFNGALAQALAQVRTQMPTLNLFEFDVASLLQDIVFDPDPYGFNNVTDTCVLLESCDGYLFFDPVHPTAAAHALLAQGFAQDFTQRVPEPALPGLLLVALLAAGLVRYAADCRSRPMRT